MAILKVQGLIKEFKEVRALDNVSFEFEKGILSFLGPSGCGKTTLLRTIAGLEVPDAGAISIGDKVQTSIEDGILVPSYARKIGFVFQNYALWPHMTVYSNVAFGLSLLNKKKEEIKKKFFSRGGLGVLGGGEGPFPSNWGGGNHRGAVWAGILAWNPRLFLWDEPLSNLDAK